MLLRSRWSPVSCSHSTRLVSCVRHLSSSTQRIWLSQASTSVFGVKRSGCWVDVSESGQIKTSTNTPASTHRNQGSAANEFDSEAVEAGPNIATSATRAAKALLAYLLPAGYPTTVGPSYASYAGWSFLAMIFSSAGGVLSMQSLLYAVGVGSGSVPLAASLNWVLKDGLGQIGGVAYAAVIGNRFDADPKRWRLVAGLVLDLATCLEIMTPLFPGYFLPLAAVANIMKNVSWLSASATRAGLHQALATHGNLADVTAKSGSQTIAAAAIGTAVGIALSPVVGTAPSDILMAFAGISVCHQLSLYQSLRRLTLPTLSRSRMEMAIEPAMGALQRADAQPLLPPSGVAQHLMQQLHFYAVRPPEEVRTMEGFLPWQRSLASVPPAALASAGGGIVNTTNCESSGAAVSAPAVTTSPVPPPTVTVMTSPKLVPSIEISVGGRLDAIHDLERSLQASQTLAINAPSGYILGINMPSSASVAQVTSNRVDDHLRAVDSISCNELRIRLLYTESAGWRDVVMGYLHALRFRDLLLLQRRLAPAQGNSSCDICSTDVYRHLSASRAWTLRHGPGIITALDKAGWWVGTPLIDTDSSSRVMLKT